ncbi:MAG: hypothetical protein LUD53_03780 [Clostridiales bacterium]|nr:hypothetical protein [Clostridiales bacterium]
MCFKMCRKCCGTILFAALVGGVVYYLKSQNEKGEEMGCVIARNLKEKKDKFVGACDGVKEQTADMASEVKHAAGVSAEEVKRGFQTAGETVKAGMQDTGHAMKTAAENIREDMGTIKKTADSLFEGGDHA